jgi:predicted ABC-type transport system involved in lysophospholipase L1 biosynthesis ATPase subunit
MSRSWRGTGWVLAHISPDGDEQRSAAGRGRADEPTGELDSATGRRILTILREIVRAESVTRVMV